MSTRVGAVEDIGRLEVAVQDPLEVQVRHRARDLAHLAQQLRRLRERDRARLGLPAQPLVLV